MLTLTINDKDIGFEHSLVSLSEWEGFYNKPFFSDREDDQKTEEELLKYFECMLLNPLKNRNVISELTGEQHIQLAEYINDARTATIVREIKGKPGPKENVTSELIYYWLVAFKIPFYPTDTWHLNRLLMLVKVCGVKNAPATKQAKGQTISDYRRINEERRRQLGTSG